MKEYTEKELDAIVEQIKAPVKHLEGLYAELTMAHAYFEVATTMAVFEGRGTKEQIKQHILDSLEAFLKANPIPKPRNH